MADAKATPTKASSKTFFIEAPESNSFNVHDAREEWDTFQTYVYECCCADLESDTSNFDSIKKMINGIFEKYGNEVSTDAIRMHMRSIYVTTLIGVNGFQDRDQFFTILTNDNMMGILSHLLF
jgi:hypothetical protein